MGEGGLARCLLCTSALRRWQDRSSRHSSSTARVTSPTTSPVAVYTHLHIGRVVGAGKLRRRIVDVEKVEVNLRASGQLWHAAVDGVDAQRVALNLNIFKTAH